MDSVRAFTIDLTGGVTDSLSSLAKAVIELSQYTEDTINADRDQLAEWSVPLMGRVESLMEKVDALAVELVQTKAQWKKENEDSAAKQRLSDRKAVIRNRRIALDKASEIAGTFTGPDDQARHVLTYARNFADFLNGTAD